MLDEAEGLKASVLAKVEHAFHAVKNLIRHRKVRCRGLAEKGAQLLTLFALADLLIAKRSLIEVEARGASWQPGSVQ